MHFDVYNTHMELWPYSKDDYPALEDMYTAVDKHSGIEKACGYIIEDGKLFLPRGTSVSKVEQMCDVVANYVTESDPYEDMSKKFTSFYDPRDGLQEESIKFLTTDRNHQLGLNLKTGLGKAQPLSTLIPTSKGYVRMGDLEVGSEIFGSDGKATTVIEIFPQGIKDIYQIIFSDGRTARCCDEHLWTVYDGRKFQTMMLKDIMKDYKSYVLHYDNGSRDPHVYHYKIPVIKEPISYHSITTKYNPYKSGQLYGSKLYGANTCDIDARILSVECDASKGIPAAVRYDSIERRIQFLKGLIDTAGYITCVRDDNRIKKTVKLYSGYPKMLNDIKELALGLTCRAYIKPNGGLITIYIPDTINYQMYPDSYNSAPDEIQDNDPLFGMLTIKEIKLVGREEAQCIMVDAKDHLYLTEDFIVTHNTFCVANASTALSERTIIITPNETLKHQWIHTYMKMFDYKESNLLNIYGSNAIDMIMQDEVPPADVYFVNHQTLRSYMTSTSGYALHQFFKKINVGIKVYDEAHMEFMNTLLIDFFSNTNRTWYLTATFDRSDKEESKCFKRAFNSVTQYGEVQSMEVVEKHVVYHVVNINSHISPKDRARVIGYRGMTAASYGKYAFIDDKNDTAYQAILMIADKMKDVEGKMLIFVPLIEAVDSVVSKLKKALPEKTVAAYHSKISKDEKEDAEKKDIIVSTIKSLGTGKDIKGLRCVICAEPIASKLVTEQMIGRLRPYAEDKETYFFDIVDTCIPPLNYWFRSRIKKVTALVKNIIYLNMDQ